MQNIKDAAGTTPGCTLLPGDVPSLGCLSIVVVNLINVAFLFLGAACLIFLLYGALLFVLSRGDQKALQKARGTMTYAVIGTVFVLLTFMIINTVTYFLGLPSILSSFTFYQP